MFDFFTLTNGPVKPDTRPTALVDHTSWKVVDSELVETKVRLESRFEIITTGDGERWLMLDGGPQSMPWDSVPEAIERGGWSAQAGSKPIYMEACKHPNLSHECCGSTCQQLEAGWFHKTYPAMFVQADELTKLLKELA